MFFRDLPRGPSIKAIVEPLLSTNIHARRTALLEILSLPYIQSTFRIVSHRVDLKRHTSSSTKRWQNRQGKDKFAVNARVQGLKSRAAFKLLEVHISCGFNSPGSPAETKIKINEKYKIFQSGQTVVDLVRKPHL